MAYGGLETGPGEGPSASHVLGAATRNQAGTELCEDPASPTRLWGQSPVPLCLPSRSLTCSGGQGRGWEGRQYGRA